MRYIISLFYLATSESGWVSAMMSAIRTDMTSMSSVTVQVATELACLFIIINLVSIAKEIMADNQMGGYGGIDVAKIYRPIVILVLIESFTPIIQTFDTTVQNVSDKMTLEASKFDYSSVYNMKDEVKKEEEQGLIEKFTKWVRGEYSFISDMSTSALEFFGISKKVVGHPCSSLLACIIEAIVGFLVFLEKWIMRCMTHLYLCILSVMGPIVFAFSILPTWENIWKNWLGTYIEVSLWVFTIELLLYITSLSQTAIDVVFAQLGSTSLWDGSSMGAIWLHVALSICTFRLLKSVPSIVHMALGIGGGGGDSASGIATNAAAKVGGVAEKAAMAAI